MSEERVLTRLQLFDLVWSKAMKQLAGEFKLSDVGLAKTCKRYGIPRPERGYWAKLAAGKASPRPKLGGDPNETIRFHISDDPVPQPEKVIPPEVAEWIERESRPENKIVVPETVHRYHPLVRKAKEELEKKHDGFGPDRGWRGSGRDSVSIYVTKPHIGRACRLMHALLEAFEARKWSVTITRDQHVTVVQVLGEDFSFHLSERQKRVAHVATVEEKASERRGAGPPRKWDDMPSGRLRLHFEHGWHKLTVEDDKALLEEKLDAVVLALVRTALESIRPERERKALEEQTRREEEERRWAFQKKCDTFDAAYQAWHEHEERLRFVRVLEAAVARLENAPEKVQHFVAWTRRYVEWADPLPKFFEAIESESTASYHPYSRRTFG